MRSDLLSIWVVRWCPGCGAEVAIHEGNPPELWCTTCRRALDAVPPTPRVTP
jgi:hypothetical protein